MTIDERVDKTGECWLWLGELNGTGYGRLTHKGKRVAAHRFFYEKYIGEIPESMEIDHLCRVRNCVRPEHMEVVTHKENIRRSWAIRIANSPNCRKGHPLSGDNLYHVINVEQNLQWRVCRTCKKRHMKNYMMRRQSKKT